jgi:hypothetical protein
VHERPAFLEDALENCAESRLAAGPRRVDLQDSDFFTIIE